MTSSFELFLVKWTVKKMKVNYDVNHGILVGVIFTQHDSPCACTGLNGIFQFRQGVGYIIHYILCSSSFLL